MLKLVNHIGATKGPQGKHLKFPIKEDPRGPYKHNLVVRVDTGADVNCMNAKTFTELFPEVKLSVALHEVSGCTCTGLTCFVVVLPVIAVEGVVVLKEVTGCAILCIIVLVVLCGPV